MTENLSSMHGAWGSSLDQRGKRRKGGRRVRERERRTKGGKEGE